MELESFYLRDKGCGARQLTEETGTGHCGGSEAVTRALSGFGSEESSGQASERFKEHYKYECSPVTVFRVTEDTACEASEYVRNRLPEAGEKYGEGTEGLKPAEKITAEPDGSEVGTGVLKPLPDSEEKTVHGNPGRRKEINWREVRTGLTGEPESAGKIYAGKTDSYPAAVNDFSMHVF